RSRSVGGPSAPRCWAAHTTRPAASPVPDPHTTPGSDHQRMRAPPDCHAVISSHRCPLEHGTEASVTSILPVQRASPCPTHLLLSKSIGGSRLSLDACTQCPRLHPVVSFDRCYFILCCIVRTWYE